MYIYISNPVLYYQFSNLRGNKPQNRREKMNIDVATITNTAQAIANMNVNSTITVILIAFVAVVNAFALIFQNKK